MPESDLRARPVCQRKRNSIEARPAIVLAALAVSRRIEDQAGWAMAKLVRTARRTGSSRSRPAPSHHRR